MLFFFPISLVILGAVTMMVNQYSTFKEIPQFYELTSSVVNIENVSRSDESLIIQSKEYEQTLTYKGEVSQVIAAIRALNDKQGLPVEVHLKLNKFKRFDIYQLRVDGKVLLDYQTTVDVRTKLFRGGNWFCYLLWLVACVWFAALIWRVVGRGF